MGRRPRIGGPCSLLCLECLHVDSHRVTRHCHTSCASQASPLVMRVLGACALAHLINDLIQAVLPSIYPMLKATYGLTLHPGRPDHPDLPTDRLAAATLDRLLHRPSSQAVAAAGRHGVHLDRHPDAGVGRQLPGDPAWRRRWWALARRPSTRKPPAWRAWPRAGATAWRSRPSRSVATPAAPSARCWQRRSSFPTARATSPGSACSRCSRSWCSTA